VNGIRRGLLGAVVWATGAFAAPVVTVGDVSIDLAEIDARCGEPCPRLAAEVRTRKAAALQALVGEALLANGAPVEPAAVPDATVDEYLATHAADFQGPPARDRAAVRFFLERATRRAATDAQIAAARARWPPEIRVADTDPAFSDASPRDRVLAEVAGRAIRNGDVEARVAWPLYRLRGELTLERRRQADALVEETLWAHEAAARAKTPRALRDDIRAGAHVSDAEVEAAVAEARRQPGATPSAERLRPYLMFRAARAAEERFLAEAAARAGVAIHLPMPRPPRLDLGPGALGWHGSADDPARVVFLTSYRGEITRRMWDVVRIVAGEPGTALAVRPLLPQWDPEAMAVATAIRCAAVAGHGWIFLAAVAERPRPPAADELAILAGSLGMDAGRFAGCAADPATATAVAAESAEAERLGLDDPPAVLVDGRPFTGLQKPNRLRAVARAARRRAGGAPTEPAP
jgi:hypothetical protein